MPYILIKRRLETRMPMLRFFIAQKSYNNGAQRQSLIKKIIATKRDTQLKILLLQKPQGKLIATKGK